MSVAKVTALHKKSLMPRRFLTQRCKAAKRCRVPKGFVCGFASLREKYFLPRRLSHVLSVFCAKPKVTEIIASPRKVSITLFKLGLNAPTRLPDVMSMLGSMLDQNKDGSSIDDLQRMAAKFSSDVRTN